MNQPVYYNEHDKFAAAWLRELMKAGEIPDGTVDERDIQQVTAADLAGFVQCHFFAGIGGWALTLKLAGWPADRPLWTGSCPCQPFSAAGKQKGGGDDRHLWPHWARLIRECQPATIVGEQVESAIAHGWLDAVFDDLESEGYACGAVDLPAASVGAFHRRQRIWFVAESNRLRCFPGMSHREAIDEAERRAVAGSGFNGDGYDGELGNPHDARSQGRGLLRERAGERAAGATGVAGELADAGIEGNGSDGRTVGPEASQCVEPSTSTVSRSPDNPWSDCTWLPCRDGKWRPTQSGLFPLAHGVSARVGRLRGYGNAIVPAVAAEVLRAYLELVA